MEARASISTDVVASYAADAAREVGGVRGLVDGRLPPQRGVRIAEDEGRVTVELHVAVDWGVSIPDVGRAVQRRVRDYLERMAGIDAVAVDVVVAEIAPPS